MFTPKSLDVNVLHFMARRFNEVRKIMNFKMGVGPVPNYPGNRKLERVQV